MSSRRERFQKCANNFPAAMTLFDRCVSSWEGVNNQDKMRSSLEFAAIKHEKQIRNHADWVPYIIHPLSVSLILWQEAQIREEEILLAALLHDTLEDTATTPEEIESLFGAKVLELVKELTEKPHLSGEAARRQLVEDAKSMSKKAKEIKLADRIHNLRDLMDHPPKVWRRDKVEGFLKNSRELLEVLKDAHAILAGLLAQAIEGVEARNLEGST